MYRSNLPFKQNNTHKQKLSASSVVRVKRPNQAFSDPKDFCPKVLQKKMLQFPSSKKNNRERFNYSKNIPLNAE